MSQITVYKLNERGEKVWQYEGKVLARSANFIQLEAFFNRDDYRAAYHTFRRGDRLLEWFYTDRWYNIFEMYDVDDQRLKGWYCNVTRPARFEADALYAEDLALDLMVYPDGRTLVLDEDEFAALNLDENTRTHALNALQELQNLVQRAAGIFAPLARS